MKDMQSKRCVCKTEAREEPSENGLRNTKGSLVSQSKLDQGKEMRKTRAGGPELSREVVSSKKSHVFAGASLEEMNEKRRQEGKCLILPGNQETSCVRQSY